MALTLYDFPLSGHAHRVRLFLSLIGVDAQTRFVDLKSGEHKSAQFLSLNPFGQVPVLTDDNEHIADSNAILVYLAKKFERTDWLPEDPLHAARVQQWLSIAAGPLAFGPAAARLIAVFGAPFNKDEVTQRAVTLLQHMDDALEDSPYLVGPTPTLADVALYSYTASAPVGGIDLAAFNHVNAWLERIEAMPGFVPFAQGNSD